MKPLHIFILCLIAGGIVALLSIGFKSSDFSTYDTVGSAKNKQGKFLHIIAKLDTTKTIEFDALKDPNYLGFTAFNPDNKTEEMKVAYKNGMPAEFKKSERLVLKGSMNGDVFDCKEIQMKCPSKYKDEQKSY